MKLIRSERGASLIEVIIALGLLGLIATTFTMAIFIATKSIMIADERTVAESLARSQMEYVKAQDYIYYSEAGHNIYFEVPEPEGYIISCTVEPIDPSTHEPYGHAGGVYEQDLGLQSITVTIGHDVDDQILSLEGFKVDAGVY